MSTISNKRKRYVNETEIEKKQRLKREANNKKQLRLINKNKIIKPDYNALTLINENNIDPHYAGRMDNICNNCGSFNFLSEKNQLGKYTKCCHDGKVLLENNNAIPLQLQNYVKYDKQFLENIR